MFDVHSRIVERRRLLEPVRHSRPLRRTVDQEPLRRRQAAALGEWAPPDLTLSPAHPLCPPQTSSTTTPSHCPHGCHPSAVRRTWSLRLRTLVRLLVLGAIEGASSSTLNDSWTDVRFVRYSHQRFGISGLRGNVSTVRARIMRLDSPVYGRGHRLGTCISSSSWEAASAGC